MRSLEAEEAKKKAGRTLCAEFRVSGFESSLCVRFIQMSTMVSRSEGFILGFTGTCAQDFSGSAAFCCAGHV